MAKLKSTFFCSNCGNESPKWVGKCPVCGEWNTYVEENVVAKPAKRHSALVADGSHVAPVRVGDGALIGAGSVITKDVPDGEMGIARGRQKNLPRKSV